MQQLPAARQGSGQFNFQQDCRSAQDGRPSFVTNISQGSVARLPWLNFLAHPACIVYTGSAQFLPCDALCCTVFVIVILFVCLSIRLSHSWTVSTWFDLRS